MIRESRSCCWGRSRSSGWRPRTRAGGRLAAAGGTALVGEIVAVLREHGDDVLACLLPMLRAAGPGPGAPLEELARDCERRLTAITERPARADDDWSVPWSGGCGCEL